MFFFNVTFCPNPGKKYALEFLANGIFTSVSRRDARLKFILLKSFYVCHQFCFCGDVGIGIGIAMDMISVYPKL